MSIKQIIFGERSLTKVAAIFESRVMAETTALRLRQAAGMNESQVSLVGPDDATGVVDAPLSKKLEPESAGIWHTVLRAHLVTGVIGMVIGALLYGWLIVSGNEAITTQPVLSLVVMILFGGIFGLLVGGLLALRPDHYRVMASVRKAIKQGRWAVVTHPVNHNQTREVINELHRHHIDIVRSF